MSLHSILHTEHETAGARFIEMGGGLVPRTFGDVAAEYRALRTGAALGDLSPWGRVVVTGADRASFLNRMVSNEVAHLQPGHGTYATFLTDKGKLIADFRILVRADDMLLITSPGLAPTVTERLTAFIIMDDVEVRDATSETALIGLYGPDASRLLGVLAGEGPGAVTPHDFVLREIGGREALVVASTLLGEAGYDLLVPSAAGVALWHALVAAGARPIGMEALEVRRIEAGIPRFGTDMDEDTIPLEARLTPAISYTKGCYMGQEVIARLTHRGHPNKLLVGLRIEADTVPARGDVLASEGADIGRVTSAVRSYALGVPIALGYVKHDLATEGRAVSIRTAAGLHQATIVPLPFVTAA